MPDDANAQPSPAPAEAPAEEITEDQVYDQAFDEIFNGDEGAQDEAGTTPEAQPTQDQLAGEAAENPDTTTTDQPGEFTEEQTELLARNHMTPEMVAGWKPEQRAQFFENAAKRENDQRTFGREKGSEVAELRKRLDQLEGKNGQQGGSDGEGQDQPGDPSEEDLGELGESFKAALSDLTDTYGDEFKALETPIMGVIKLTNTLQDKLGKAETVMQTQNRLVVDMVIDKGMSELATDYPSLSEAKPRADVEAKFTELWQAKDSKFRLGEGPVLSRVKAAIKAAADTTLGTRTEAAAQAQLLDKTKKRLNQQPRDGSGRTDRTPTSEDEMYDQAFEETIGKKI